MYFEEPLIPTGIDNLFYLAPIPVYFKQFDDNELADEVYDLGYKELSKVRRQMGQELPDQYDTIRQSTYSVNYDRKDRWVEPNELNPIGSRYFTPHNEFLNRPEASVKEIKKRCVEGFIDVLNKLNLKHNNNPKITESWLQYYEPTEGRGHNAHNHCRWSPDEAMPLSFVGGYYLSDGDPIADHPYSGAFTFHIRGMSYFIRPKKNMLMMWPYDIVHSVKPFYGKSCRSVINFNIQDNGPLPSKLI